MDGDTNNNQQGQAKPLPSNPVSPSTPEPKKSTNKGLIIGLIAGAVFLFIVVALLVGIFIVLSKPNKKDYATALDHHSKVSSELYNVNSKTSSLYYDISFSTENVMKNNADDIRDSSVKVKEEAKRLSETKAVKSDGKLNELYNKFDKKMVDYLAYVDKLVGSMVEVKGVYQSCKGVIGYSAVSPTVGDMKDCASKLGEADDKLSNEVVKNYASKAKLEVEAIAKLTDEIKSIKDPYGDSYEKYKTLRSQLRDHKSKLSDLSKDFRSDLERDLDDMNPKDESDAIRDALYEKVR